MHEMAITQSILDIAVAVSAEHGNVKVEKIRIKMGEYSGVVPSLIQEYYNIASRGTTAENAELIIERVPVTVLCRACGYSGEIDKRKVKCPVCGGRDLKLLTGREFYVESLEVEDQVGDKSGEADPRVE